MLKFPAKKLGKKVTFSKIVHSWLKDEIYLSQYDQVRDKLPSNILQKPHFDNLNENQIRLQLLRAVRGTMIYPLPPDTEWFEMNFTKKDLERTFIVPSPDWLPLTNQTYHIIEALKNIDSELDHASKIRSIKSSNEGSIGKNIIIVASSLESLFTVIEGNHHSIAFSSKAMANNRIEDIFKKVFIGISSQMKGYIWHIESRIVPNPITEETGLEPQQG